MHDRPLLVIATGNAHKVAEMEEVLGTWFTVEGLPSGYEAPAEDGQSFAENARIKAETAARTLGALSLADDSGICVDALNGAPGIHSARYAGEPADDLANNEKLLAALAETPESERGAHYVCALSLADVRGQTFACQAEFFGSIGSAPRGSHGFGYDPLFVLEDGRTAAEIPADEKRQISHRARALEKLALWLEERRTVLPA